jgi:aminopeptidase N
MADANDSDAIRTAEFGRWYSQAGTPTLTVVAAGRNSASGDYELTLSQATEPTPGQPDKLPLLLPVAVGVLVSTGADTSQATELQLRHKGTAEPFVNTLVLQLTQPMQTFVLELGSPAPSPAETAGAKVEAALPAADQRITLHSGSPFTADHPFGPPRMVGACEARVHRSGQHRPRHPHGTRQ